MLLFGRQINPILSDEAVRNCQVFFYESLKPPRLSESLEMLVISQSDGPSLGACGHLFFDHSYVQWGARDIGTHHFNS